MKKIIALFLILCTPGLFSFIQENKTNSKKEVNQNNEKGFSSDPIFKIIGGIESPVIRIGDHGTENNKYGFEGGRALKLNNVYHIFTTEMWGEPFMCKTRLAHWKSKNGIAWVRAATLFESNGDFTGNDSHASLWSPVPTFDEKQNCWILTYVCYRSKPNTTEKWFRNYDGIIALAKSSVKGRNGIDGPYIETSILMKPDTAEPKFGLMGVESFFPYQVNGQWFAIYGSSPGWIALAKSPALTGPWERLSESGVVGKHTENPVVSRLRDGRYVVFFDGAGFYQKIGYMVSSDGIHWSKPIIIDLENHPDKWWGLTRTPLGLIDEGQGNYILYFTAYNNNFYKIPGIWQAKSDSALDGYFASVGMINLKLIKQASE
jgi:hypothetical protein